jgi:hypothetical protein
MWMSKRFILAAFLVMLTVAAGAVDLYEEFRIGYGNDLAAELGFRITGISAELPLSLKASGGYIRQVSAGNADDARSIFINDATNGTPSEYGESWFYGVTVGYGIFDGDTFHVEAFGVGRQNVYNAFFIFTGGNEAFRVTTTQFGLGGGVELVFGGGDGSTEFSLNGGVEYYFPSRIDSHGTFFYTPDGADSRPRNDYTYEDADGAINQPILRPFASFAVLIPLFK